MELSLLAFALVFALAFANGANDVSKAIATLVGSGITDYRSAIAWGTAWTMIGAAFGCRRGLSSLVSLTSSSPEFSNETFPVTGHSRHAEISTNLSLSYEME